MKPRHAAARAHSVLEWGLNRVGGSVKTAMSDEPTEERDEPQDAPLPPDPDDRDIKIDLNEIMERDPNPRGSTLPPN
jgi:hypothetical protein